MYVCVRERERGKEIGKESERERERGKEIGKESERERELKWLGKNVKVSSS